MKFMVIAYNPMFVNPLEMDEFIHRMSTIFDLIVIPIKHMDKNAEPIYCVEYVDSNKEKNE